MQDEQKKFQEKLSELLSYARNHENKVTMKEVRDFFEDFGTLWRYRSHHCQNVGR